MELVIKVDSLDILTLSVNLLNSHANSAYISHEVLSELLVSYYLILAVPYSELLGSSHGDTVEETSSCEAWQVLTVRVTSKDKAFSLKANWFVWVRVDH